jgi:hypothetical protein
MARQSRRSRAKRHQEPERDDIFSQFEGATPGYRGDMRRDEPSEGEGGAKEPTMRELLDRIANLQGQVETLRELPDRAPAPVQQQEQRTSPKDVKFTLDGLPNPIENPDEYNRLLTERVNAFVQANGESVRQDVTERVNSTTSAERMRREFYGQFPEWEEHDKIVGLVAAEVAEERGLTPAAIAKAPRKFYNAVAEKLDKQYGALVDDAGGDADGDDEAFYEPKRRRRERREDDQQDDGRTAGMFSGMEAGGRPLPTRKRTSEQGDMIAELHAEQRKSGFF